MTETLKTKRNVLVSCILLFSIGFEMGGFQTILRTMADEFSLGPLGMGLLVATQYAGIILMPALFGGIADRTGKKRMLVIFMGVFCVGTLLVGVSSSLGLTVLGFLAIGSGYGVAESVSTALLGDHFREEADRYINLSQASLCIGAVTAPLVSSLPGFLWRWVFLVSCAVCLGSLVLLLVASDFSETRQTSKVLLFDGSLFRSNVFLLLFISMLLYVGLENGFGYIVETYFHVSMQSSWGAYAIALYWGAMALSRIISSIMSGNLFAQLKYRFLFIALLFILLWASRSPLFSLGLCTLVGFFYGPIWSFIMALAVRSFPKQTAGVTGLISTGSGLGGVLFPVLMRIFAGERGFLLLTVSSLLACMSIVLAGRRSVSSSFGKADR